MPADPSWLGDPKALFLRLGVAAGKCSIELACAPYLASVVAMIKTPEGEKPRRYVDGYSFAAWLEMVNSVMTNLLVPIATAAELDEKRTIDSLLFVLELITHGEPDGVVQCEDIAAGKLTLEAVLRARELVRLTDKLASAEQQLANAPVVQLDPQVLAALEDASFLRGDDVAIPIPPRAVLADGSMTSDDGKLEATFTVPAAFGDLHMLYRTWAQRDGWLIEHENGDDQHNELRLARRGNRVWLLLTRWVDGDPSSMMIMRLACKGAVRFESGTASVAAALTREARLAAGPALPPPITRHWPAVQPSLRATPDSTDALSVIFGCSPAPPQSNDWSPEHVVADRGLLYIADKYFIWCVDPGAGRMECIAGKRSKGPFEWISGLAFDGDDTLFVADRHTNQVSMLELSTNRIATLASGLDKPTFVACSPETVYVVCRETEIHAIDRATGAFARFASCGHRIRALVMHGRDLYALDDDGPVQIDRTTGGVTRVMKVTSDTLTGLASDGTSLFATTYFTICRITSAGKREVLAGTGKNPRHAPDGLAEDAYVADSIAPVWDGAGLVFISRHCVRRFDFTNHYVSTLPVPPSSTSAIEGTVVGVGSLGGARIALGLRKFRTAAAIVVLDYATGERRDIPLDATNNKLRAFATDGADLVFFTDDTDAVFTLDTRTDVVAPFAAIARSEHPVALAVGAGRLFALLAESRTAIALDLATQDREVLATDLARPKSLAFDAARSALYIGDAQILRIDLAGDRSDDRSGDLATRRTQLTEAIYAGTMDGPRGTARFVGWEHMTVGADGNLYFSNLSAIRRLRVADGHVSTVIGRSDPKLVLGPLPGGLVSPTVLCTLPTGELAIVDRDQNLVLRARLTN